MHQENDCGYLLPVDSTPAAKKYIKEGQSFFCDPRLQDLIAKEMSGQIITNENITCCTDPQKCPLRIPSIESLLNL